MNLRHLVFVSLLMAAGALAFQDGKQSKQQSHGKKPAVKRRKDGTKPQSSRRRSDDPPPVGDPGPWPINPPKAASGAPLAQNGPKDPWPISPPQPKPTFVDRYAPDKTVIFHDVFAEFDFNQPITQDANYVVLYRLRNSTGGDPDDYTLAGNRFAYMSVRKGAKKAKVYMGTTTQSPSAHDKDCRFNLTFLPMAGARVSSSVGPGPFGPWPISPPASSAEWVKTTTARGAIVWRLYVTVGVLVIPATGRKFNLDCWPVDINTVPLQQSVVPRMFTHAITWTSKTNEQKFLVREVTQKPTSEDKASQVLLNMAPSAAP